jgi:hypothetical protein
MMSSLFYPDILSTRCKELELSPSQDIFFQWGIRCILHPQLKKRSQLCKIAKFLRPLDILSLLDKHCMMSNQFGPDILSTRCKELELGPSQDI